MRIVVTGANGFIGKNLLVRLRERAIDVVGIGSDADETAWRSALEGADHVFHLAGVNRPTHESGFVTGNVDSTRLLTRLLKETGNTASIAYASSIHAERDNPYGLSKREAEDVLFAHASETGSAVRVFRLANVFGKWARPNYNSAVATFCYNIANGMDISVNDPSAALRLVYVDDVCDAFLALLDRSLRDGAFAEAAPVYETTVGAVADAIRGYAGSRATLISDHVGVGLHRALYSTYLSYLAPNDFAYDVPKYGDPRGVFVEMLKTPECGQFSYFTAGPGITRGDHYHHTKTEKFLVLTGKAHFGFRHILTGEQHEIVTEGGQATIVETIPGWTHNITNIGEAELVVMLWANEIFDRARPDTVAQKV